jgi:hypothetical protein
MVVLYVLKDMLPIEDKRITKLDHNCFQSVCENCKSLLDFSTKNAAQNMLKRGSCRNCKIDYRSKNDSAFGVYKNEDGKWCSTCSGCGIEQAYTRKDHARQSSRANWLCRKCAYGNGSFQKNNSVGNEQRLFNKFKKSASQRNIVWDLTVETMFSSYDGKCALTGWDLSISYSNCTASLDRIDCSKGYTLENIQWVHVMVNMSKNKYKLEKFIEMCKAVAENN